MPDARRPALLARVDGRLAALTPAARLLLAAAVLLAGHLLALTVLRAAGQLDTGTVEYERLARQVAGGHGFRLHPGEAPILWRPPLYVYLLASLFTLGREPVAAVLLLQMLFHAGAAMLVYRMGERWFGPRTALLGVAALSVYPLFAVNAGRMMPESLYVLEVAALAAVLVRHRERPGWRHAAALGALTGVAALTKASIQFFPLFLLAWELLVRRRVLPARRALAHGAVAIGVAAAVVAPWTLRNYRVSGEFIPIDTSGGYTFWIGNRLASDGHDDDPLPPEQREGIKRDLARVLGVPYTPDFNIATTAWASAAASGRLYREGLRGLLARPLPSAWLALRKLGRFWFSYVGERRGAAAAVFLLQALLLAPAVWGSVRAVRRGIPVGRLAPLVVYFPLLHAAATSSARYAVPLLPFACLFAAYGLFGGRAGPGVEPGAGP